MPGVVEAADPCRLPFGVPAGYGAASIRRAVVHEQQFPVDMGLVPYALDRLLQEALAVEKGDHDGNQGRRVYRYLVLRFDGTTPC